MVLKYDQYVNEFKNNSIEQELLEMANASEKITGIESVVILMGPSPKSHSYRIKVSNIPNSFDIDDCFTITIPDFNIIGNINKFLIDNKKFKKIIKFIEINIENIILYSDRKIETFDFLNSLIKNLKKINF